MNDDAKFGAAVFLLLLLLVFGVPWVFFAALRSGWEAFRFFCDGGCG